MISYWDTYCQVLININDNDPRSALSQGLEMFGWPDEILVDEILTGNNAALAILGLRQLDHTFTSFEEDFLTDYIDV